MARTQSRTFKKQHKTREVDRAITRMHAGVLALTCGFIGGVGLCGMTVWLLLKGGPHVGAHLQLLRHYFIGYSVTWPGSIVGLFYGALLGAIVGWSIGCIYNGMVYLRHR